MFRFLVVGTEKSEGEIFRFAIGQGAVFQN